MYTDKDIKHLAEKYSMTPEQFVRYGSINILKEKKRKLQIERLEILANYKITTVSELENKIKKSEVSEHPAWENLIEIKNIESEIREIESDIGNIQAA